MTPASQAGPRVAFFGGSFDPPHLGHVAIAAAAQQALALDRVLFAPVGLQPLKPAGSSASFEDRVAMIRLAIAAHPGFELSLIDAPDSVGQRPNYTYDTLIELRQSLPSEAKLFLLLGADSFATLHQWHRSAELLFAADLIVASRPGEDLGDLPSMLPDGVAIHAVAGNRYRLTNTAAGESALTILPDLHYDISATQLRAQIAGSTEQPPLLDPAVLEYIHTHGLYRELVTNRYPL
jgi:nicotinate-nucleotide adenylyltransferase